MWHVETLDVRVDGAVARAASLLGDDCAHDGEADRVLVQLTPLRLHLGNLRHRFPLHETEDAGLKSKMGIPALKKCSLGMYR